MISISNALIQHQVTQWPTAFPHVDPRKKTWIDSACEIGKIALKAIFILPILRDFVRGGFRWIASKCILPASLLIPKDLEIYRKNAITWHKNKGTFERIELTTPDGAKLDGTLYVPRSLANKKLENLLMFVDGNACFYEHRMSELAARAEKLEVPVFMFNPRGVGSSTYTPSPGGLALDVYSAYRFAHDKLGIKPGKVLLHGWSLGGAYGNMGASLIQQEPEFVNEELSVINDRSFSDLDKAVRHLLGDGVLAFIACKILKWIDWKMDSHSAMQKLKGKKLIIHVKEGGDPVIDHGSSMTKVAESASVENLEMQPWDDNNHTRPYSCAEEMGVETFMRKVLHLSPKAAAFKPLAGTE